jgi:hypothetical protein
MLRQRAIRGARGLRRLLGPLFVVVLALVTALPALPGPALAGPAQQQTLPPGVVVALAGTPHLFIVDEQGTLHWGGDTKALANRNINWSDRRIVSLDQLRGFRRGDPWLSSGLLKIGEPIYQVKWESNEPRPTLLHIQSLADVDIFGINASNYGIFVMERAAWEQRFGMSIDGLPRGSLASAVPQAGATPTPAAAAAAATTAPGATAVGATPTPGALKARLIIVRKNSEYSFTTEIEVTGAPPGRRLTVESTYDAWDCCPISDSTHSDKWGPRDAGPADSTGKLIYKDEHGPYKKYFYTFKDVNENTVRIEVGNDRDR